MKSIFEAGKDQTEEIVKFHNTTLANITQMETINVKFFRLSTETLGSNMWDFTSNEHLSCLKGDLKRKFLFMQMHSIFE